MTVVASCRNRSCLSVCCTPFIFGFSLPWFASSGAQAGQGVLRTRAFNPERGRFSPVAERRHGRLRRGALPLRRGSDDFSCDSVEGGDGRFIGAPG